MNVIVIVIVNVIANVNVIALVNGNANVDVIDAMAGVIDTVDDQGRSGIDELGRHRHDPLRNSGQAHRRTSPMRCASITESATLAIASITPTFAFPFTSAITITFASTFTFTSTSTSTSGSQVRNTEPR